MRTFRIRDLLCVAASGFIAIGLLSCDGEKEDGAPQSDVAQGTDSDSGCPAPSSWFPHDQTPEPDNNGTFTTNCDFHQWSWQMFLWLTQEVDGVLRFETFKSPNPPGATEFASRQSTLLLMPRVTKDDDPTTLEEINQAGSQGMLIDQNGRAVYFAMYVNDTYTSFVQSNNLNNPDSLFVAPDTLDFPVGAMELKAAWKVIGPGDDSTGIYTRPAKIAKLVQKGNQVVVDPKQTEDVTVALVGLHIAGVVNGHPEFIWATFEHNRNAPTLTDAQLQHYLDPNDTAINNQPVSDKSWTFYKAGTTFIQSNQNNAGFVKITNASAQTMTPITNAFLQYAQGGGKPENRANIVALNESVNAQLKDPIFSNYYLGGAIWLNGADKLVPNSTLQDLMTGSTALSNVTMETFTQKVLDQRNCFSCHNTLQRFPSNLSQTQAGVKPLPGKNVNVSHILVNHYFQAAQSAK